MAQETTDKNFNGEPVHNGNGITSLKFFSNGDFFASEKRGVLLYFKRKEDKFKGDGGGR